MIITGISPERRKTSTPRRLRNRKANLNRVVIESTVTAALGGLLFGFDTAVIAGITTALSERFHLTPTSLGFTVAIALWGTIVVAATGGYAGDRFGRRDSLGVLAILFIASAVGCACAWDWSSFVAFRFIAGIAIGASSVAGNQPLFSRRYRITVMLAVLLALFNQFSGINPILYYLNDIFAKAGFTKVSGDLQAIAIGATNLIFTGLAMSIIDKVGRKRLLSFGSVGTFVCLSVISVLFYTGQHQNLLIWPLIGFVACFAVSQGSVIWVYISEVFPNSVRGKGQSLGCFTHWITCAMLSNVFPVVAVHSAAGPFIFFAAMMALQFFVVLRFFPETKGFTLEQLQAQLETE
jgi:MFS family permease